MQRSDVKTVQTHEEGAGTSPPISILFHFPAPAGRKHVKKIYFLKMHVFGTKKSGEVSVRGSNFVWRLVHFSSDF